MASIILLISHILADFYFQTDKMVKNKKNGFWSTGIHSVVHFGITMIIAGLAIDKGEYGRLALVCLCISSFHGLIDSVKIKILQMGQKDIYRPAIFIMDQVMHTLVILICSRVFDLSLNVNNGVLQSVLAFSLTKDMLLIVLAALLCWRPASYFVVEVFATIGKSEKGETNSNNNEIRIGSWIGVLEREIILFLGLMQQFGAIGFVLAAKSLARYKQLEEKDFAERYLVGTLISTLIAILCIVMCQY